jgi:hypothetical protein
MIKILLSGLAGLLLLNSCTQYQAQGAGVGALGGAAIGALAGNDRRDVLRGAAIGAALGTGVTAMQENERRRMQQDEGYYRGNPNDGRNNGYPYENSQQPPSRSTGRQDYPVAERTDNPNRVISPYGPNYNVIDVSGFKSGQLARDPSNQKIFVVP